MRHITDKRLCGHAMIFEGPLDILKSARKYNEHLPKSQTFVRIQHQSWNGRAFQNWDEVEGAFGKPLDDEIKKVDKMLEKLRSMDLPQPKSRKRKMKNVEDTGEVDVDRALHGDPDFYRRATRETHHGPATIALICNLDAALCDDHDAIFWRGCAAIACTDVLEQAGYGVEIWMWCLGRMVYPAPYDRQFTCCRVKKAGDTPDIHSLITSLNGWFTRVGVFGSFMCCPTPPLRLGGACMDLGEWKKYLDIEESVQPFHIAVVTSEQGAIQAAKDALAAVSKVHQ